MTIEETITEPLQRYIEGAGQLIRFSMLQTARKMIELGETTDLHRQMEPFYAMWIDDGSRVDWTLRSVICDIANIDPLFGGWASRQDSPR